MAISKFTKIASVTILGSLGIGGVAAASFAGEIPLFTGTTGGIEQVVDTSTADTNPETSGDAAAITDSPASEASVASAASAASLASTASEASAASAASEASPASAASEASPASAASEASPASAASEASPVSAGSAASASSSD